MKMYYVSTNGYDMIVADHGDHRRVINEYDLMKCGITPATTEEEAVDILSGIEDDSSWDLYDETVEELTEDAEIIAELETEGI